ncbi:chymotrypsin inhibitor-like [Coccinella septempunctata]|uniref:chymotrypsin inhibitor-like n=1 Tax=Coccinella septempunctata TaxID=41139 RepID=UPI001D07066A|nr:chymotrypsin inhibitor-like [Coccinella septempunctata]
MRILFPIFLAFIFVCIEQTTSYFVCPPNEFFDSCGSACFPTCQRPPTKICIRRCEINCFCMPGFIRDEISGKCVRICP